MATILPVEGKFPKFGKDCFVAPNATIVGDVEIGDNTSIWFNTVVRGDVNSIRIGSKVNIQDGVVIHATYQKSKTIIGNNVSIGHNAIVHGCTICDKVLIGMGAILLSGCEIGAECLIAAGTLITENRRVPPRSVVMGVPGKVIREVTDDDLRRTLAIAAHYLELAQRYTHADFCSPPWPRTSCPEAS